MKNIVFLLLLATSASAQSNAKFIAAMEKALAGLDTLQTAAQWQEASNRFERIAQKEPGEWLPAYYIAYSQIMIFNTETDPAKREPLVGKADRFVALADSLQPENSEIYVLKNMATVLHIRLDPMTNGPKYSMVAGLALEKAKKLDPENPRAYMQEGLSAYFTPPQFGGDKQKGRELLEKAAQKFETFKPASSIHPVWGKAANARFLEMARKG
jgi:hypothetical protein